MLGSLVIVFREVLEAALIIGIVAAATEGIAGRGLWIAAGIASGVAGAGIVAALASEIASAAEGVGQELLNASILFAAVLMLAWHNIWMSRHAREMVAEMKAVGGAVSEGARPLSVIAIVVGLAVLREGSEVVLFLYGIASSGTDTPALVSGSILGLLLGAAAGFALYLGLLRIPTRHLFTVTGWMILLLAGGMAADAARFLVQADLLPDLGQRIWDSSAILDDGSILGKLLHTLIGYTARPSGMQVLTYGVTVAVIGGLMLIIGRPAPRAAPAA